MEILPSLTGAIALGINVHAVVALVRGMRTRDATVIARHARRCGWSVAGLVVLSSVGVAASVLTNEARQGEGPEDRAARLAMLVSGLMNTVAFTTLAALLPCAAAMVLHLRARRAKMMG